MTLYEGMALIQEKQAVVLDLGTDYTKFGFTGEAAPRCIIPSEFWCSDSRRMKRVFDYHSEQELYDNLVHMLHLLYFRHVLVNPKERKVVVVESLLTPTLVRETLAKVLFMHYEVSGVMWADAGRLCALTLGAPVALVVMIGAMEAEVISVVHGVPILSALQTAPLGARAITAELRRLLLADNPHVQLTDAQLEDIKGARVLRTVPLAHGSRGACGGVRAGEWGGGGGERRGAGRRGGTALLPGRRHVLLAGYHAADYSAKPHRRASGVGGEHPGDGRHRGHARTEGAHRGGDPRPRAAAPILPASQDPDVQVPHGARARQQRGVARRRAARRGGRRRARTPARQVRGAPAPARLARPAVQHPARSSPPRAMRRRQAHRVNYPHFNLVLKWAPPQK